MTGLELPILAMEHMYLITEEVPELARLARVVAMPGFHCVDFGGEIYMREEGNSLLLGTYERNGVPWSPHTTDWNFGAQLLTPDLERIAENLDVGFKHFPIFQEIGIKDTINGPFTFAPDGNPLIGPVKGQPGHWLACGVMAGLSQGGGVGLSDGELDDRGRSWLRRVGHGQRPLRRLGDAALHELEGARELRAPLPDHVPERGTARGVANHMHVADPRSTRRATTPCSARRTDSKYALWFQRPGEPAIEDVTFRRSNAFDVVADEVAAVRNGGRACSRRRATRSTR